MKASDIYIRRSSDCGQKIVIVEEIREDIICFRKLGREEHICTSHSIETFNNRFEPL